MGVWAAYSRNAKWLRIFFYVLLFMFILDLCALIIFIVIHQSIVSQTDTSACDDAVNPEDCRRQVHEFAGTSMTIGWIIQGTVTCLVNLWFLSIVYSYLRIVELGGTGDEMLTPEEYEA